MKVVTQKRRRGGDAELIGSHTYALGVTVSATAPVLALRRQLIAAVLCLRVRSIGEAAQLRIATHGGGCASECTAASPVAQTPVLLCPTPSGPKTHQRGCCAMSGADHHRKVRGGTVRIITATDEDAGGDDDSNYSFDKIMQKPGGV